MIVYPAFGALEIKISFCSLIFIKYHVLLQKVQGGVNGILIQLVLFLSGIPVSVLHVDCQHGLSHFGTFCKIFGGQLLDDKPVFNIFLEQIGDPLLLLEFLHFGLELCSISNLSVFEGSFVLVFGEGGLFVGDGILFFLEGKGVFPAEGLGQVEALIDLHDSGDGGKFLMGVPFGAVEGAALGFGVPPVFPGGVHGGEVVVVEEGNITIMFDHNNYNKPLQSFSCCVCGRGS